VPFATIATRCQTFDWAPECGISLLNVATVGATPADVGETVWAFHLPETAPLGPAVTYGVAPARAHMSVGPKPLVVGTRYVYGSPIRWVVTA
jgi:hypothetical protein